ncbi:MAG: hypothetical protein DBP01_01685 [gamma proteobacterium symbiont of Ctena orbiculata]|nr:MAG: hypothetical protein DBP01_01685 [gamma proteobacterium symbiont of Ctena orbiculata]
MGAIFLSIEIAVEGLTMTGNSADGHQREVERFWRNHLSILEKTPSLSMQDDRIVNTSKNTSTLIQGSNFGSCQDHV